MEQASSSDHCKGIGPWPLAWMSHPGSDLPMWSIMLSLRLQPSPHFCVLPCPPEATNLKCSLVIVLWCTSSHCLLPRNSIWHWLNKTQNIVLNLPSKDGQSINTNKVEMILYHFKESLTRQVILYKQDWYFYHSSFILHVSQFNLLFVNRFECYVSKKAIVKNMINGKIKCTINHSEEPMNKSVQVF